MPMKRTILLLWLVMPLVFAAGAAGDEGGPAAVKVKVTAEVANIRLKPSIGSIIIRQIPQGEILEATKKEGPWFLVTLPPDEAGTASGYVHESLVLPLEELPRTETKPSVVEKPVEKPIEKPLDKPAEKPKVETPPDKPQSKPETVPQVQTDVWEENGGANGRFFFSLFAGGGYAIVGDLNRGAQGLADLFSAQIGVAASGDVTAVHTGFLFGGEIGIPLGGRAYITLGAERLGTGSESLLSFLRTGGGEDTYTALPKFSAIPIRAAIVVYPADFFYLKFGANYTFGSCSYNFRIDRAATWQEWTGEAQASAFGLFGGAGLEWKVGPNFALFGELTGQYGPISGFEGTGTFQDSTLSVPASQMGKLYAYEAKFGQTLYPQVFVRESIPSEANVENAREAKINGSGFALRLGIRLRL